MEPHPRNAAGDFYVENGCCSSCDVPIHEAPELFQYDETNHCFVKRQPRTPDELRRMLGAIMRAELGCIRYRGSDPELFERLGAVGATEVCDHPPPEGIQIAIRNHVTFRLAPLTTICPIPKSVIQDFGDYLVRNGPHWVRYEFTTIRANATSATFSLSWFERNFHKYTIARLESINRDFLAFHENDGKYPVLSGMLSDWLESSNDFQDIRWYTRSEWEKKGTWHRTPW